MKYLKLLAGNDVWKEITYDEALDTLLGTYRDNAATKDMLRVAGKISCMYSDIAVVPDGVEVCYDEL